MDSGTDFTTRVKYYSAGSWHGGRSLPLRTSGTQNRMGAAGKIIGVGATAYVLRREVNKSVASTTHGECYLQSTADALSYTAMATLLQVNASANTTWCDMAYDGTSNLWVAEVEHVSVAQSIKTRLTTTPQVYVFSCPTSGASCTQQGASLNNTAGNYASWAQIVWMNGKPYVCWIERPAQTGQDQLYCKVSNDSGATWTALNSGNPISLGGWAYKPSLTVDATNNILYVMWPEQTALGQPIQIHGASFNGTTWTALSGIANPDTTGSAHAISATMLGTTPVVAMQSITYGTVPQIYASKWTGSAWSAIGTGSPAAGNGASLSGTVGISGKAVIR